MKPASVGVRVVLYYQDDWGADLNHQHRVKAAKRINAMVKAEVMKERRRCAKHCENHAKHWDEYGLDAVKIAATSIRKVRDEIISGSLP